MLRSTFLGTPGGGGCRWGRGPCLEPEPQQWRRGRRSPKAEHLPEIIAQSHHLGATWRFELAQAAATQPSAGSASPCRDRTRACGRPESNATRIKTIHRHRRRFQAHRLLHDSAFARPPGRRAQQERRNRKPHACCRRPSVSSPERKKLHKLARICATVGKNYE